MLCSSVFTFWIAICQRRWIVVSNPSLCSIISKWLGTEAWIRNVDLIAGLREYAEDPDLHAEWKNVWDLSLQSQSERSTCLLLFSLIHFLFLTCRWRRLTKWGWLSTLKHLQAWRFLHISIALPSLLVSYMYVVNWPSYIPYIAGQLGCNVWRADKTNTWIQKTTAQHIRHHPQIWLH